MVDYVHPASTVYTFVTANRAPLASLSQEERGAQLAQMPLPRQAEYKRAGVEEGIASTAGGVITGLKCTWQRTQARF